MSWKFTGNDKNGTEVEPIPGLPFEATDEAFESALKRYEQQYPGGAAAVKASGLYEHITPKKPAKED